MRNARKQERTWLLNLFSCLPIFLIQSLIRFGRLKNLRGMQCKGVESDRLLQRVRYGVLLDMENPWTISRAAGNILRDSWPLS
jgi:hypothetical protein